MVFKKMTVCASDEKSFYHHWRSLKSVRTLFYVIKVKRLGFIRLRGRDGSTVYIHGLLLQILKDIVQGIKQ